MNQITQAASCSAIQEFPNIFWKPKVHYHVHKSLPVLFCLNIWGWSQYWVHSALRPFIGLLYLPRVIVRMEKLVE
jgi:hypothetical protein